MKKALSLLLLAFLNITYAQTTLNKGDIVVIGFNVTNNTKNWITFLSRTTIPAGTVISVTNDKLTGYSAGHSSFTAPSGGSNKLKITLTESMLAGQTFKVFTENGICYSSHGNSEATGTIDIGNNDDYLVLWLYQEITVGLNTTNNTITGLAWDWGNGANKEIQDLHPEYSNAGIIWSEEKNGNLNTNANSLNLDVPGSSAKCGSWNPFTSNTATPANYRTAINLSDNITNSGGFYNKSAWTFGNSNGWNTCNLTEVDNNVVNGFLATKLNTTSVYRKTCSGWESSTNGGTSWVNESFTDWPTSALASEVRIECDHTLDATNFKTYSCYRLVIGNSAQSGKITLTVDPGNNLLFSQSLSFIPSSNNTKPELRLRSGDVSGTVMYATIEPSSAPFDDLDGNLCYEYYIKYPGWHHLQSPISSKFQDISVTYGANSTVANGTTFFGGFAARYWSWDPSIQQWVNRVGDESTADFSTEPYTIYIQSSEVPAIFTVTGPIPTNLRDQTYSGNKTADKSAFTGSGTGNVPWIRTGGSLQGNNFYGNPFPSFLDTEAMLSNYASFGQTVAGQSAINKMQDLNTYLRVWDPSTGTSQNSYNVETQYLAYTSSYSGGSISFTGDTKAKYLPPFQAFVMKSPTTATGSTGFAISRRYRVASSSTVTSSSVTNKGNSNSQHVIQITGIQSNLTGKINVGPYSDANFSYKESSDVPFLAKGADYFGAYVDSTLLSMLFWPVHIDSSNVHIHFSSSKHDEFFKLHLEDEVGAVFDRKLKKLHFFKTGDYYFQHDSIWNNIPRFKWYFNDYNSLGRIEDSKNTELSILQGSDFITFQSESINSGVIIDMRGSIVANLTFKDGIAEVSSTSLSPGVYIFYSNDSTTKFLIP